LPVSTFCPRILEGHSGKTVAVRTGVSPLPIPKSPRAVVDDPPQKLFDKSENRTSFCVFGRTKLHAGEAIARLASLEAAATVATPTEGREPGGRLRTGLSSLDGGLALFLYVDDDGQVILMLVMEPNLSRPSSKALLSVAIS
jgi:hypothetical protein